MIYIYAFKVDRKIVNWVLLNIIFFGLLLNQTSRLSKLWQIEYALKVTVGFFFVSLKGPVGKSLWPCLGFSFAYQMRFAEKHRGPSCTYLGTDGYLASSHARQDVSICIGSTDPTDALQTHRGKYIIYTNVQAPSNIKPQWRKNKNVRVHIFLCSEI